jgi:hypothetical protein
MKKKLVEEVNAKLSEIYEFANVSDSLTGIPKIFIHVFSQGDKYLKHGP